MHIFLTGEIQVGKTTIIKGFLEQSGLSADGFVTYWEDTGNDALTLFLAPQNAEAARHCLLRKLGDQFLAAEDLSAVFDVHGAHILEHSGNRDIIVMDELGFLESDAFVFQDAVLRHVSGGVPILGVMKPRHTVFLDHVRSRQNVELMEVTKANREHVLHTLLRRLPAILLILLLLCCIGCARTAPPQTEAASYLFTDSCGREVPLPAHIERIAPSGPLAQIVLYTLYPDKMVGFATELTEPQLAFIDQKYAELPVFGNFYGDTLNLESVMAASPQMIIDIGEAKPGIAEDMDGIQRKTGIPTIFVQLEMESMSAAYETLGSVTGAQTQAREIVSCIETTLSETREKLERIPEDERVRVYYGLDDGLSAAVKGTAHSEVIELAGGLNVADVEEAVRGGTAIVSMEQLMLWNPDVILFAPNSIYSAAGTRKQWQLVSAIQSDRFYEIPDLPYNWMNRPPSVNRVIGIKWLSQLLYPDLFDYDMAAETRAFYKLFYHCDVTDEQIGELLGKSTYKRQNGDSE